MKNKLREYPLSNFLLPMFFVLHGYRENYGYIGTMEALLLFTLYLAAAVFLFLIFLAVYRRKIHAGIAAGMLMSIFFFFGAWQDWLKVHFDFLNRYSVLLTVLFVVAAAIIFFLKRTSEKLLRLNFFLTCLLLIYLVVDAAALGMRILFHKKEKVYAGVAPPIRCDTCAQPDIYFLVFDAYQGTASLREKYRYDNSRFDDFLQQQDFHIQPQSHANYKYTILSIPSILNMGYLDGLKDVKGGPLKEYDYLSDLIRDNQVCGALASMGYDIVNCSIFDLHKNPSPVSASLLPLKTRLITDQTLFSRCFKDIGWHFFQHFHDPLSQAVLYRDLRNNNILVNNFTAAIGPAATRPRFVYGHFNLPHPPYYFDSTGRPRAVTHEYLPEDEDDTAAYFDYLVYTNRVAEDLILRIKKTTGGRAVIILMGDHGLRYHDRLGYNPRWFVQNQNAVYFPSGNYSGLYDSISGVNQFRVVFNSLFKSKMPMLKDSIVNVKDKK